MARNFLTGEQKTEIFRVIDARPRSAWGVYEALRKSPGLNGTAGKYITQRQVLGYIRRSDLFFERAGKWHPIDHSVGWNSVSYTARKYD